MDNYIMSVAQSPLNMTSELEFPSRLSFSCSKIISTSISLYERLSFSCSRFQHFVIQDGADGPS